MKSGVYFGPAEIANLRTESYMVQLQVGESLGFKNMVFCDDLESVAKAIKYLAFGEGCGLKTIHIPTFTTFMNNGNIIVHRHNNDHRTNMYLKVHNLDNFDDYWTIKERVMVLAKLTKYDLYIDENDQKSDCDK